MCHLDGDCGPPSNGDVMRSYLYVPGDQPDKMAKALRSGADGLILDLEDAVAPTAKIRARTMIIDFVASTTAPNPELWVRINQGALGLDDVTAIVGAVGGSLAGLYVPKVTDSAMVRAVDEVLRPLELFAQLEPGLIRVSALLETAGGILDARRIARSPRVMRLAIGEADLAAELGVELTPGDERELLLARSMLVLASAEAGIEAPVGPVSTDFRDLDALRLSTVALRRMGFRGRAAIHPAQIPVINDVFTPTDDDVTRSRRIVELYDTSIAEGSGVCLNDDGKMIDEAVARSARRIVELARRLNNGGQ